MIAADHEPLAVDPQPLLFGRLSITGWYSGHAQDTEDTLNFAALKGIRPVVETFPLAEAETAFGHMAKARYRGVLVP